ncbi:DUF4406 domain-containing protein [Pseudomonas sp. SJZ131]|uniref:DUF4406 domain-containing protein n=1 Tax=Pseudomonas sp. SJZ131 TaxID=2572895 RepID=UPI0021141BCF|nr:DUF4406 domain-containing protein [Pseudomonas sp. SJZ131]
MLPGWENSQGASLEVLIAHRLGMTVVNAHDLVSRGMYTLHVEFNTFERYNSAHKQL